MHNSGLTFGSKGHGASEISRNLVKFPNHLEISHGVWQCYCDTAALSAKFQIDSTANMDTMEKRDLARGYDQTKPKKW